jgi:putative transport protein
MRGWIVDLLVEEPVLLLMLVVGLGALVGRVRVAGVSLGPAAALFCGLAVSAWDSRLSLPEVFSVFGLVLFAYSVGVATGPQVPALLGRRGAAGAAVAVGAVGLAALVALGVGHLIGLDVAGRGGLFAGALTNTPALAAVTARHPGQAAAVAYSLAYPGGVIGALLGVHVLLRRHRRHAEAEVEAAHAEPVVWTVRVERELPNLGALREWDGQHLVFSRFEHAGSVRVATVDAALRPGDLVTVVGDEDAVRRFTSYAGARSDRHLPLDRHDVDFRRMSISNRDVAGRRLGDLDLEGRFGVTVTRIRRGDTDVVAHDDVVLVTGDRVRVVGPPAKLDDVRRYLGDSAHSLADIDLAALALGIAAGMLVGRIPVPIPGGSPLKLGNAGGALIVGLVVGARQRIGPLHFSLPFRESLVLRNLGTAVFLATVGTRSGHAFANAVGSWTGLQTVAAGAGVSLTLVVSGCLLIRRWLGSPADEAAGSLAGLQTQPAVLAAAQARAVDPAVVALGYALLYPAAMIAKLLVAQLVTM